MNSFGVVGAPYVEVRSGRKKVVGGDAVGDMDLSSLHEASAGLHVDRTGCLEILDIGTRLEMDLS